MVQPMICERVILLLIVAFLAFASIVRLVALLRRRP
jgi:hypothetical protein